MTLRRRVSRGSISGFLAVLGTWYSSTGTIYPLFGAASGLVMRAESAVQGTGRWYEVPRTAGELIAVPQTSVAPGPIIVSVHG
jgi:hypothetical protein